MNYDKKYLGRADLSVANQKLSFLDYIHPNSYQQPVRDTDPPPKQVKAPRCPTEEMIASEHIALDILNDQKMKRSYHELKKPNYEEQKIKQSKIEGSKIYASQIPNRLISASQVPINTPVLEQFMHDSNIRRNMGDYNSYPQKNQLNVF